MTAFFISWAALSIAATIIVLAALTINKREDE